MSAAHGTYAGATAHRRAGEDPCEPCREAAAAYQRERRAKRREAEAAPAASVAAWPVRLPRTENEADFLVLAPFGGTAHWNLERWVVQAGTRERTLVWGAIEELLPTELLNRIRELVNASRADGHPIKVVVVEKHHITGHLAKAAGFKEFTEDIRVLYAEPIHRGDKQILQRLLAEVYRDESKHLPADCPDEYLEVKRRQLDGGPGIDHLLADWLAESNLPLVVHAAGLPTRRQIETERERPDTQPTRHRVQGATVARGRMWMEPDYSRPETAYEEIPEDHPARKRETYIVTSERGPVR